MNPLIDTQLSAQGVARVIITLKEGKHSTSDLRASLGKNFVSDETAPERPSPRACAIAI